MALTGARKIAALLLTLDSESAAKVLKHLGEDNLAALGIAMADIDDSGFTPEEIEDTLREFRRHLREGGLEVGASARGWAGTCTSTRSKFGIPPGP